MKIGEGNEFTKALGELAVSGQKGVACRIDVVERPHGFDHLPQPFNTVRLHHYFSA
jgi:hypothetical protein